MIYSCALELMGMLRRNLSRNDLWLNMMDRTKEVSMSDCNDFISCLV